MRQLFSPGKSPSNTTDRATWSATARSKWFDTFPETADTTIATLVNPNDALAAITQERTSWSPLTMIYPETGDTLMPGSTTPDSSCCIQIDDTNDFDNDISGPLGEGSVVVYQDGDKRFFHIGGEVNAVIAVA